MSFGNLISTHTKNFRKTIIWRYQRKFYAIYSISVAGGPKEQNGALWVGGSCCLIGENWVVGKLAKTKEKTREKMWGLDPHPRPIKSQCNFKFIKKIIFRL